MKMLLAENEFYNEWLKQLESAKHFCIAMALVTLKWTPKTGQVVKREKDAFGG